MPSNLAVTPRIDYGFIEITVVCQIRTLDQVRIASDPENLNHMYSNDLLIIFQIGCLLNRNQTIKPVSDLTLFNDDKELTHSSRGLL